MCSIGPGLCFRIALYISVCFCHTQQEKKEIIKSNSKLFTIPSTKNLLLIKLN